VQKGAWSSFGLHSCDHFDTFSQIGYQQASPTELQLREDHLVIFLRGAMASAAVRFVTGFVPVVGPAVELGVGVATGNPWLVAKGVVGLAADIASLGTSAVATSAANGATAAAKAVQAGQQGAQLVKAASAAKRTKQVADMVKNVADLVRKVP